MQYLPRFFILFLILCSLNSVAHDKGKATEYSAELAHAPTPLPDRVVLTWEDDPATTQSVTWRTNVETTIGKAHLALANSNGRALELEELQAETTYFKSDINEANYHSITFRNLKPDTLYTYRVGDGVNWTCLLYTSPSPRDVEESRMPSSA